MRLLVELEARVREFAPEYQQPGRQQNNAIDRRVPKGNLRSIFKANQAKDLRGKFQNAHERNEQAESVKTRTKGGQIDLALPPPDADVDQQHDDAHEEPFNGTNDTDQSKGDNVCDFQGPPSQFVRIILVRRDPVVEIELFRQQCRSHGTSNVQDVRNWFPPGSESTRAEQVGT